MSTDNEHNGWRLEDDTEIRENFMNDEGIARMLSMSPNDAAVLKPRWTTAAKIAIAVTVVLASFGLGVLFSQNTQLKDESSKLSEERAGLHERNGVLGAAVDQCRDELTLCAEDVDLLQELSEYELTPKTKYGEGFWAIRELEERKTEIVGKKSALQMDIETAVQKIWRPAKKSRAFWKELKHMLAQKRKLDRKLKQTEKKLEKETAQLDQVYYEKKVKIHEVVKEKNAARRQVALSLEAIDSPGPASAATRDKESTPPLDGDSVSAVESKQDLAAVVP